MEAQRPEPSASERRPCCILNPTAGSVAALPAEVLNRASSAAEFIELSDDFGPADAARRAIERGFQRIIMAGGDGTIHQVFNGLAAATSLSANALRELQLAVWPVGTGNDLARSLGLPVGQPAEALELALTGPTTLVDVVRLQFHSSADPTGSPGGPGRYYLNNCQGGFGGRVADEVDPATKARWGMAAFWMTLVKRALDLPEHRLRLRADDREFEVRAHGIMVANACTIAGGVPCAPQARLNDGLLDVLIVPVQSIWDALVTTMELVSGRLDESTRVFTFTASRLELLSTDGMELSADGEALPDDLRLIEVVPGGARMVATAEAPALRPAMPL